MPLSFLGIVLSVHSLPLTAFTGQLENVYGFVGLIGVVSFAIIGMLYKIVPFLIWFGTYSKHIGRAKVPALADMYSAKLQALGFWSFLTGLLVTTSGILLSQATVVRIGGVLLLATVITLLVNIGSMVRHYFSPQLASFKPAASSIK